MTKTIGVNLTNVPVFNKSKAAQRALMRDLGLGDVSVKNLSVTEMFLDRIRGSRGKDDDHFKFVDDNDQLVFESEKVENEVKALISKHFADQPQVLDRFSKINKEMEDEENELDLDEEGSYGDADISRFKRAAWLFGQLEFLKGIDKAQDLLKTAEYRSEQIKKAKDPKKASEIDVSKMLTEALHSKHKKKSAERYSPARIGEESRAESELRAFQNGFERHKKVFMQALNEGEVSKKDIGARGRNFDREPLQDLLDDTRRYSKALIKSVCHPFTRGILTTSNPLYSDDWREFKQFANQRLAQMCNDPKLDGMKGQLERLQNERNAGLLSEEEFNALIEFNKAQVKVVDKEHEKYLKGLEGAAKEANEAILKKIKDDNIEGDDLNKYRIIQLLLLVSPLLPIPIAGVIFNAFQPFLSGALDIPQFLSSFFNVSGPFGNVAWLTDKMGLDSLITMVGNLFGTPLGIVQNLIVNPITSPIMTSVGGGFAGSPLAGFALMAAFDVVTNYTNREIDHLKKSSNILPDAKKGFEATYAKLRAAEVERLKGQGKKYVGDEIGMRKDLFVAAKAADWLQGKYKSSPEACNALIKNLFGDKASELMKALKDGDSGDVAENVYKLYALKSKYGFQDKVPEGKRTIKITDLFEEDGKKIKAEFLNADGSLKAEDRVVEMVINGKSQYYSLSKTNPESKAVLDDLFHINSGKCENGFKSLLQLRGAEDGKNSKLVSQVFDLDDNIEKVNQLKAKYKFEPKAEGEIIKITDVFEADGKTFKAKFLADDKKSLKFSGGLVELTVDGKPQYYSVKSDAQTATTLGDLFVMNGTPQKLVERQKIALRDATKGVDYNEIAEGLKESDFYFYEAGKLGIKHSYLPALGNQLLQEELARDLSTYDGNGYNIYGQDAGGKMKQEEMIERMILVDFIFNENGDLYELLLEESRNNSEFNFTDFLLENGINENQQKQILENYQPIKQSKLIVMQNYLNENKGATREDAQEYLADQGFDSDTKALRMKIQEIEKSYESKKKMALMPITVEVNMHYEKAFEGAKWIAKKPDQLSKVPQSKEKTTSQMDDLDQENEPQTPTPRENTKKRDMPFVDKVGGKRSGVGVGDMVGKSEPENVAPQSETPKTSSMKKRSSEGHAQDVIDARKKSKIGNVVVI